MSVCVCVYMESDNDDIICMWPRRCNLPRVLILLQSNCFYFLYACIHNCHRIHATLLISRSSLSLSPCVYFSPKLTRFFLNNHIFNVYFRWEEMQFCLNFFFFLSFSKYIYCSIFIFFEIKKERKKCDFLMEAFNFFLFWSNKICFEISMSPLLSFINDLHFLQFRRDCSHSILFFFIPVNWKRFRCSKSKQLAIILSRKGDRTRPTWALQTHVDA